MMVENVRDYAMFMVDPDGRIVRWNVGAERVLGWKEEEIIGQRCAVIFTPEDREKGESEKEIETARRAGHAADERWHLRKNGTRFFGSGMMMAVKDESGRLVGFTKVLRDETERRRADEQLRRSHDTFYHLIQNNPFHPDDRDAVMRAVGDALRLDGPGEFEVEQRIVRTDGATRWIRVRGRAVFAENGGAAGPLRRHLPRRHRP